MRLFLLALFLFAATTLKAQVKLLPMKNLESRMAQGADTTYVINFWATWCAPCVKELPNFEKLQQTALQRPVKVILMSLDFKSKLKSLVIPFVKKHQLRSEIYVLDEADQQKFIENVNRKWSGAIPATLIVNTGKNFRSFFEKEFSYIELVQGIEKVK